MNARGMTTSRDQVNEPRLGNEPSLRRPIAILFDMGNVLLDAVDEWSAEQFPISFPQGLPEPAPLDWFLGMSGEILKAFVSLPVPRPAMDVRPHIGRWLEKRNIAPEPAHVERWFNILCQWEAGRIYPFVPSTLDALHRMGFRLGVISNTLMPATYIRKQFREAGLLDLFEFLVFSAEFGINKPDPRLFRHALDAMQLAPADAWFVGDKPQRDVCGAHSVGMTAVMVDSKHAAHIHDAPEYMPDLRIRNIADLPGLETLAS